MIEGRMDGKRKGMFNNVWRRKTVESIARGQNGRREMDCSNRDMTEGRMADRRGKGRKRKVMFDGVRTQQIYRQWSGRSKWLEGILIWTWLPQITHDDDWIWWWKWHFTHQSCYVCELVLRRFGWHRSQQLIWGNLVLVWLQDKCFSEYSRLQNSPLQPLGIFLPQSQITAKQNCLTTFEYSSKGFDFKTGNRYHNNQRYLNNNTSQQNQNLAFHRHCLVHSQATGCLTWSSSSSFRRPTSYSRHTLSSARVTGEVVFWNDIRHMSIVETSNTVSTVIMK